MAEVQRFQRLHPSQYGYQVAVVDIAQRSAADGIPHRAGQGQATETAQRTDVFQVPRMDEHTCEDSFAHKDRSSRQIGRRTDLLPALDSDRAALG